MVYWCRPLGISNHYTMKLTHDFRNKMEIPMNKSNKKFNWKLICMLMFRAHDFAEVRRKSENKKENYTIIVLYYTYLHAWVWVNIIMHRKSFGKNNWRKWMRSRACVVGYEYRLHVHSEFSETIINGLDVHLLRHVNR